MNNIMFLRSQPHNLHLQLVLVMNLPSKATKSIVKSMFGPYGQVRDVRLRDGGMAVVENVDPTSVACALEKHYSSGITVYTHT